MAESEFTQENIAYIRTHVDNLERMVRFEIAANPSSRAAVNELLRARAGAPEFYLALEAGPKTQPELAALLGRNQSNVSRIAAHLYDGGLIARVPGPPKSKQIAYAWSDLEQLLGVSKIARKLIGKTPAETNGQAGEGLTPVSDGRSVRSDGTADE